MQQLTTMLVDDWRDFAKWWSVRMMAIGGVISAALAAMPSMPQEVQDAIPVAYRVTAIAVWSLASLMVRLVKQSPQPPSA